MTIDFVSRRTLLAIARHAIGSAVDPEQHSDAAAVDHALPVLAELRGAFVTLHQRGRLRGCIGRIEPDAPLRVLVPDVARAAALSDPRFPAVRADDLRTLVIEISLLSVLATVKDVDEIEIGRHGLVIAARGRRGLLLPQVAVEFGWSRAEFLSEVCAKAGLAPDAWRDEGVRLQSFTAEVFSEQDE
ncbi:MAG TPA: AmmeMemoRadiSam system protein A [Candidatus Krumholzibacteria bacterium]|nr:AmmeMemoRadiSam system protein A [Candidatus Krumholzibacteria bacterium]